jgi:hypothetical protein
VSDCLKRASNHRLNVLGGGMWHQGRPGVRADGEKLQPHAYAYDIDRSKWIF